MYCKNAWNDVIQHQVLAYDGCLLSNAYLSLIGPLDPLLLLNPDIDLLLLLVLPTNPDGLQVLVVDERVEGGVERRQEVDGLVDGDGVLQPLGTLTLVGRQLTDDRGHLESTKCSCHYGKWEHSSVVAFELLIQLSWVLISALDKVC